MTGRMKQILPKGMLNLLRRGRRWMHELQGRDVRTRAVRRADAVTLGSEYGGWTVASSLVNRQSIVYSFGVGHDISWDLEMIARFGVRVHAFDPTPAVAEFLGGQNLPAEFEFHPVGLAGHDGELRFSFRQAEQLTLEQADRGEVVLPVQRLTTWMQQLGHDHLDVLKVDIEGSELALLDDLVQAPVTIGQLLVEFHHSPDRPESVKSVERALGQIESMGFELFFRSAFGREFSFVHRKVSAAR
jgi:FkbM family methyltransferase